MKILNGHDSEENAYIMKVRDCEFGVDQDRKYWVESDGEMVTLFMKYYCLNRKKWLRKIESNSCFRGEMVLMNHYVTLVGPKFL